MRPITTTALLLSMLVGCALVAGGCANCRFPQIDTSGERIFTDPASQPKANFAELPKTNKASTRVGLIVCPKATVAPIGSEVILLAGVRGPDNYLRTNERVEWMIDPGSVGQFVDLDKGSWTDPFVGDFTKARKIDNCYAINTTSRRLLRLTRGTADTSDDVEVLKGQSWVTATSACEGTTDVTVYAPGVSPWDSRTEACQIHWVDAQWCFPSPAIANSGGRQIMTTTVTRQSDCAPRRGWIVRYEVVDGPPAGFAPDGTKVVEVTTDAQGKAAVELFQTQSQAGTNKIAIQVIRPSGLGCPAERLVIGRSCVLQTWSAPDLAVRVTGPAAGSVGSALGFRIEVSNPGDIALDRVTLSARVPAGLGYLSASPTSEGTGANLRWTVGRLGAGEVRSIAVDLRAERAGQFEFCAEAVAFNGLTARGCANAAVETTDLSIEVIGPTQANVGDAVTHQIIVNNRGNVPATDLVIVDRRDAGLGHDVPDLVIDKSLGTLGPMQSRTITITFRMREAGRLCHTVQITGAGGLRADKQVCIDVRQAYAPSTTPDLAPRPGDPGWVSPEEPFEQPPFTDPPPVTGPRFEVEADFTVLQGDQEVPISSAAVGDRVRMLVGIISPDNLDLSGLEVTISPNDPNVQLFKPLETSGGYEYDGKVFTWPDYGVTAEANQLVVGQIAVVCECLTESRNACFHVTVRDASGQVRTAQSCIPIVASTSTPQSPLPFPPPTASANPLDVNIDVLHSPVNLGKAFFFQVQVANLGTVAARGVEVQVPCPRGLTPLQRPGRTQGPTPFKIQGDVVLFDPYPSLLPGTKLDYQVWVQADQTGEFVVSAYARSADQTDGASGQTTVKVNTTF